MFMQTPSVNLEHIYLAKPRKTIQEDIQILLNSKLRDEQEGEMKLFTFEPKSFLRLARQQTSKIRSKTSSRPPREAAKRWRRNKGNANPRKGPNRCKTTSSDGGERR